MADHTIRILKHGGVWKAIEEDPILGFIDPKVHREDTVIWDPDGTDVTINFPEQKVFLQSGLFVYDTERKSLKVKKDAEYGEHPYSVYCHQDSEYAQGNAGPPPVIIVEAVL